MKRKDQNHAKPYSDIRLGFGAHMAFDKFRIRHIFSGRWWSDVKYEIKAAHMRAFRGYDDSMWWDMDVNLTKLYIRLLLELADHADSVPNFDGYDESKYHQMSVVEIDKSVCERIEKWREYLATTAGHFYESISCGDEAEGYRKEQFDAGMAYSQRENCEAFQSLNMTSTA